MHRRLLLSLLAVTLAACGPKVVTMKALSAFPRPLVEPLPVSVGVYFPPEFAGFTHKEKRPPPSEQEWTITLGTPASEPDSLRLDGLQGQVCVFGGDAIADSHDGTAGVNPTVVICGAPFALLPGRAANK